MEDDELQAIRARRMAELQAGGSSAPQVSGFGGGQSIPGGAGGASKDDEAKKGQMEEMRRTMLFQILDNSARERCKQKNILTSLTFLVARIQMVKADKARAVEDLLIRMAQSNQLRNKVTEQQLIDLLGQINQQEPSPAKTRIVYNRRRFDDDSDEEYDL
ncbi:PDCD5-related protein [Phycomyces nitens]|nr:PDCD5-related protein [Phycomyces nitens]